MYPLVIHRVATTAMVPLIAAGGWAGYAGYANYANTPYQPSLVCTQLSADVRPGSTAGEIAPLQQFLAAEGYLHASVTGYFGQATYMSLTRFQADHGLPITGIADSSTRAVIRQMSCNGYPQYYPYQAPVTQQVMYPYPNNTPSSYAYGPSYPNNCSSAYDRGCYVNGQYVGPAYQNGSTYNGPGDTCEYLNGQWVGNCDGYTASYNGSSYNSNYGYSQTVDYSCYYDRACNARMGYSYAY